MELHTIGDYPIDLLLVRCGTSKLILAEHSNNLSLLVTNPGSPLITWKKSCRRERERNVEEGVEAAYDLLLFGGCNELNL